MSRTVKRVCNLCEAMCGLNIEITDSQAMTIRGNRDDVFSRGAFCPKSQGLKDLWLDPDRVRRPLKKVQGRFEEISWNQAFTEISQRINSLQKSFGFSSIATYAGNPNTHHFGNHVLLPLLQLGLKSENKYSATSVDQLPHSLVSYLMYGHQLLLPIADIDHAHYILMLGANPAVSNGSLLSAAGLSSRLKSLQKKSGKLVVFDPRYTETATLATEHHFIRPGTDAFLLSGLLHLVLKNGAPRLGRLAEHVKGLQAVTGLFADIDLDRVADVTGVPRLVMESVAAELLSYQPALCYGRMGVSTQIYGTQCQWMINLLNILTGNFDREGSVLFTKPAIDLVGIASKLGRRGSFGLRHTRVRKLPEFDGEMPVATLSDEILTPGEGQIKGLITIAGNPVLSTPNGRKLERALEQLELQVAIDIYQNETSSLADYILPPTSALEHSHYDLVFNGLASRNIARYSEPVVKPAVGSYEDWEILLELWSRIGNRNSWLLRGLKSLVKKILFAIGMDRIIDLGLRFGPYGKTGLNLKKLKAHPDGIDLGALMPSVPSSLQTPDKKIDLLPEALQRAWALFRSDKLWHVATQGADSDELQLIGRRNLKSNNSWMHNLPSLARSKDPCTMIMHFDDATRRQIADGSRVRVSTSVGSIELPVQLSDRIMKGVVSVPHGFGHGRRDVRLSLAQKTPGVSVNDIVDDSQLDAITGNAILNGQRVQVSAVSSSI